MPWAPPAASRHPCPTPRAAHAIRATAATGRRAAAPAPVAGAEARSHPPLVRPLLSLPFQLLLLLLLLLPLLVLALLPTTAHHRPPVAASPPGREPPPPPTPIRAPPASVTATTTRVPRRRPWLRLPLLLLLFVHSPAMLLLLLVPPPPLAAAAGGGASLAGAQRPRPHPRSYPWLPGQLRTARRRDPGSCPAKPPPITCASDGGFEDGLWAARCLPPCWPRRLPLRSSVGWDGVDVMARRFGKPRII